MSGAEPSGRDKALEGAILAVYRRVEEAWGRGDAEGVAYNFAPEGDLIDPFGYPARHRDQVAAHLGQMFSRPFRGSHIEFTPELTRRLSDEVAVSDGTWRVTLGSPDGGPPPPPIGGRVTTVFRKVDDRWLIESDRPMLPAPPSPGASPPTGG